MKKILFLFLAALLSVSVIACAVEEKPANTTSGNMPSSTTPSSVGKTTVAGSTVQTVTEEPPITVAPTTTPQASVTSAQTTTDIPQTTTGAPSEDTPPIDDTLYNILFVGNSYTFYNDMPTVIFRAIAKDAGYNVRVTSITKGGSYLITHADGTSETGKTLELSLSKKTYDCVIIQEQSTCPVLETPRFYDGVRAISEKIKASGSNVLLYSTWGRKTGSSTLTSNNLTNETMTWKLAAAYTAIAEELDLDVAYVGLAFYDVYTNNPNLVDLYDADKTHPSYAGSYLAAMTIFSKIFGVDPTTIDYNGSLSKEPARVLREAAKEAVFNTPAIPDEYKTSSEGITGDKINFPTSNVIDDSKSKPLTSIPSIDGLITVVRDGNSYSGILGTKGQTASKEYSATGLTDAQKADIADIGYGISVIGIEKSKDDFRVEALIDGEWPTSKMATFEFDSKKYDINGNVDSTALYTTLITLNFGSTHRFDSIGFASGSLQGFPGTVEVYVSDDGENWTKVPTACWDHVNGRKLTNLGRFHKDFTTAGSTTGTTVLFDMEGITGQYIRMGVVIGRNDSHDKYNTINTRELLVFGEKLEK